MKSGKAAGAGPIRVATLIDGSSEGYGLASAIHNLVSAHDPGRVRGIGLFLNDGSGYKQLHDAFVETRVLDVGPVFPMRKEHGSKYAPIFLTKRLLTAARAIGRIRSFLLESDVAIVHTHDAGMARLAHRAARGMHVRRVLHYHGPYIRRGVRGWSFRRFARSGVDRIAVISRYVGDSLPQELQHLVRIVYNGVPVARMRGEALRGEFRRRFGLRPDQPLAGVFGVIQPRKGQEYFVEAAARVAAKLPDARFAIVGDAAGVFKSLGVVDHLKALICELRLQDRFILTGYVPDAVRYMADFDVVVMPTVPVPGHPAGEGFGMVMIEAMAHGVATIATDCGAPREVLTQGVDGMLVPAKDAAALGEAMWQLMSNRELRHRLGEAGARTVKERFDARVAAARLEDVYEELMPDAPGGGGTSSRAS